MITNLIKKLFGIGLKIDTGVRVEPTYITERQIHFNEIVASANPVEWKELDTKDLPEYTVYDQSQTLSCVAHTRALMASIMYKLRTNKWVDFSPSWIYWFRINFPDGGMQATDSFEIIANKKGLLPLSFFGVPKTEKEINSLKPEAYFNDIADGLKADRLIVLPAGDFDTVASVMQTTGKPVMVWFYITNKEWKDVPTAIRKSDAHHSVTFIPPTDPSKPTWGLYKGKKAIVIQDSWGLKSTSFKGKRIITEDFFKARNSYADYFMRFKFDQGSGGKPSYVGSIISLQKCLQYEGLFPSNVSFVEIHGPITKEAVNKFQIKYGLSPTGTGFVGPATKAKLEALYP